MSAHTHSTVVPGCYRCELSADEVTQTERETLAATIMEALDSLWVSDGRVLGKLHARDEILSAALGGGDHAE